MKNVKYKNMDADNDKEIDIKDEVSIQLERINIPLWKELQGLIIFICFFVIVIPIIFFKTNNNFMLLYYFSNLDLIANVLNYWNGYFDNLYFPNPLSEYSFFSSTLINFFSLLGISIIIANITLKYKDIFYSISSATTSLLITYLVPTTFVYLLMVNIDNYMKNTHFISETLSNTISVFVGLLVSFIFILLEVFISRKYIHDLVKFYKTIFNIVKTL
jgi:hypothetical protein